MLRSLIAKRCRYQARPRGTCLASARRSPAAVLPQAQATDIYLAGLGILLTVVYMYGLVFRPDRRVVGMGIDSLTVLVLYAVGLVGLIAVTHSG